MELRTTSTAGTPETPTLTEIVRIVLGVVRLGDADLFGWWRSRSYTAAAQYVLGSAAPRTWLVSALEASLLSAAIRHAEVLTRPTAVHLFSSHLPALRWALGWLREQKAGGAHNGLVAELRGWERMWAAQRLAEWVAASPPTGEILGQERRVGTLRSRDLANLGGTARVIRTLAACYTDQDEDLRIPCFEMVP